MIQPNQPVSQPTQADKDKDRNRQKGTGFTNLNRVLGANQGAGQKMGQQIGNSLSNQAGQIKQGIQAGQSQFQTGMQQGTQKAKDAIGVGQNISNQLQQNQDAFAQQDQNQLKQQGQALQGAAYQGPQGIQNAGKLQSQSATASALGKLGATGAGQQQLLASQVAGRGGYGLGQSSLDRALLSRGGQQAIQQGRSSLSGIESATKGAIQGAQGQATATAADIDANKVKTIQELQNRLSGAGDDTSGGIKGLTQQAKEQTAQYNTQAQKLQQMLSGRNPDGTVINDANPSKYSQEDIDLLNNMGQYGLDPSQMLYSGGSSDSGNTLARLTQNANTNQSAGRYMGSQGAAAKNLATFLQQNPSNINTEDFKEQIFSPVTQQEVLASNKQQQSADEAATTKANQLAQMKANYDALYNASGGGTKAKFGTQFIRDEADKILNQMRDMGTDVNRSVGSFQQEAASRTGQQKSLQQLALERLGQKYTAPEQKGVDPSKTKVQK